MALNHHHIGRLGSAWQFWKLVIPCDVCLKLSHKTFSDFINGPSHWKYLVEDCNIVHLFGRVWPKNHLECMWQLYTTLYKMSLNCQNSLENVMVMLPAVLTPSPFKTASIAILNGNPSHFKLYVFKKGFKMSWPFKMATF